MFHFCLEIVSTFSKGENGRKEGRKEGREEERKEGRKEGREEGRKPFRPGRISKFEIRTWFDIKALLFEAFSSWSYLKV